MDVFISLVSAHLLDFSRTFDSGSNEKTVRLAEIYVSCRVPMGHFGALATILVLSCRLHSLTHPQKLPQKLRPILKGAHGSTRDIGLLDLIHQSCGPQSLPDSVDCQGATIVGGQVER